jgi:flagellar motor protein MotB
LVPAEFYCHMGRETLEFAATAVMKTLTYVIGRVLPVLFAGAAMRTMAQGRFEVLPVLESAGWRVEWPTIPGHRYKLQRSTDLLSWQDALVLPATATGSSLVFNDVFALGQERVYWRALDMGVPADTLNISWVFASFRSTESGLKAELGVITEGEDPVASLEILNGAEVLGSATFIAGRNIWSLLLPDDLSNPRTVDLRSRATTESGIVRETQERHLLLADPTRFIPLNDSGQRLYGDFIETNLDDSLKAFVFYPEGLGDADQTTGVHIEFPAGARVVTLNNEPGIEFSAATFFGGHTDTAPVQISGVQRRLEIDHVSPAVLAPMLGLPAGAPVPLLFGRTPVQWRSGELNAFGWRALKVRGTAADFVLPPQQFTARVVEDPETKMPWLVDCYAGEWRPLPGGPVFRVPVADPLKFHHNRESFFFAGGTVEVEFPNGTMARGSVSFRNNVFEVRFAGRSITIPALGAVRRLLPASPELCVPAGAATPGQLDLAAECLKSYRTVFRAVSAGGQEQSALEATETLTPPAAPSDPAGAALEAWAGRVASWRADHFGLTLTNADLEELSKAVADAGKTGVAANEPATPLKMVRDILSLRRHAPAAVGTSEAATAFLALLAQTEDNLFTATIRLLNARPEISSDTEVSEIALLLLAVDTEAGALAAAAAGAPAPRDNGPADARTRAREAARAVEAKLPIVALVQQGGAPPPTGRNFFNGKTTGDLLAFLVRMKDYLSALKVRGQATRAGDAQPPERRMMECLVNLRDAFSDAHESDFRVGGSFAITTDFEQLRLRLADRARFFQLNAELGEPIASNDPLFQPPTPALLDVFAAAFQTRPLTANTPFCSMDMAALATIREASLDSAEGIDLGRIRRLLLPCTDDLRKQSAAADCDTLTPIITKRGLPIMGGSPANEGTQAIKATGQFQSESGVQTLQLSQGGRLLRGRIQTRGGNPSRIDGLLASESPDAVVFSIIESDDVPLLTNDGVGRFGTLTVTLSGGKPVVDLAMNGVGIGAKLRAGLEAERFVRVTDEPAWSPILLQSMTGEAREVFEAQQRAPLHAIQIEDLKDEVTPILNAIVSYLQSDPSQLNRLTEALNVNQKVASALSRVSPEQRPAARQVMRQLLSRTNIDAEGTKLNAWNWLRVIFSRHAADNRNQLAAMIAFMGPEIDALSAANAFRYSIRIEKTGAEIDAGLASVGINGLIIEIDKRLASSAPNSPPVSSIILGGGFGQGGIGPGLRIGGGTGDDDVELFTSIDYSEASLSGPMMLLGGSASIGVGFTSRSKNAAFLMLYGNGLLPPLAIPLPEDDTGDNEVGAGLGINFGLGAVGGASALTNPQQFSLVTEPVRRSFTTQTGTEGSVHFDLGLAVLRPCGRFGLREFVAEFRAIFENPQSTISILGFTDPSGTEQFNAQLSQDRAATVRTALIRMMGKDPQSPALPAPLSGIRAFGVGELPARGQASPAEAQMNAPERALVARKKAQFAPPLADGVKDQRWRTVTVLLNNLITVDLQVSLNENAP